MRLILSQHEIEEIYAAIATSLDELVPADDIVIWESCEQDSLRLGGISRL